MIFFTKRKQKEIELEARPVADSMGGESGLGDLASDEALSRPDTAPPPPIPPSEREEATVDVNVWSLNQFYPFSFFSITAKKKLFFQTHNQGLRQLFILESSDLLRQAQHTQSYPSLSVVLEAMIVARMRALKVRCVSSQSYSGVQDREKGAMKDEKYPP